MKRIFIVNKSFYPAFKAGGPARSLTNIVRLLRDEFEFSVLTKDRDSGDNMPFDNVQSDSHKYLFDNVWVYYESPTRYSLPDSVKKKISSSDILYLNSFFDSKYTIRILMYLFVTRSKIKVVLAPRGELTPGSLSIKPFRKKLYLLIFRLFKKLLAGEVVFHFTSDFESDDAQRYLGEVPSVIAPNLSLLPGEFFRTSKSPHELDIAFCSRISVKKQLDYAIDVLSKIDVGNLKFVFNIYGPVDDQDYWLLCQRKLTNLPHNVRAIYHGEVCQEDIHDVYLDNHVLFLPTMNENYGHVIVESMKYGCLPIISKNTPWSDIVNHGGYVCTNEDDYILAILGVAKMGSSQFASESDVIQKYINQVILNDIERVGAIFKC